MAEGVREIPKLEGWVTFPEAAEILGVTKQACHKMVFENGDFDEVRAVGSKPVYIIAEHEVTAKKQERFDAALLRQQKREEREAKAAAKLTA